MINDIKINVSVSNKQFENFTEKKEEVILRGKKKVIYYMSAPLKVVSHKRKYRIIALKYEGELEYRYIILRLPKIFLFC